MKKSVRTRPIATRAAAALERKCKLGNILKTNLTKNNKINVIEYKETVKNIGFS